MLAASDMLIARKRLIDTSGSGTSGSRPMLWRCKQRCSECRVRCGIVGCSASGSLDYVVLLDGPPLSSLRSHEELDHSASFDSEDKDPPSKPEI